MGIREKLNKSPTVGAVGTVIVVAIVVLIVWRSMRRSEPASHEAFYTNDDGASYYRDQVKPLPFQKDGKDVARAMVFTCDRGVTTFVGYLMRPGNHDEPPTTGDTPRLPFTPAGSAMEVKAPGATTWVSVPAGVLKPGGDPAREAYDRIMNVKCPEGSGTPMLWNP